MQRTIRDLSVTLAFPGVDAPPVELVGSAPGGGGPGTAAEKGGGGLAAPTGQLTTSIQTRPGGRVTALPLRSVKTSGRPLFADFHVPSYR